MSTKAIQTELGNKAFVYSPYVLLRSLQVWKARSSVAIPGHIRTLIESTYADLEDEPDAWRKLFDERFATDLGKKFCAARNTNLWQAALEDEEGVQTRLNDVPTVSLVLCKSLNSQLAVFLDGAEEPIGGDEFRMRTAQAIHRNVVRVPKYRFAQVTEYKSFSEYLHGEQTLGLVADDGSVQIDGLVDGIQLHWDVDLGLLIKDSSERSGI
jgi:CRISPR-associated endonuclease/helicase Cas3